MLRQKSEIRNLVIALRPRQWLKNLSLFAAITFWGDLFKINVLTKVTLGAIVFCGLSSAMYLLNDVVDAEEDRRHPIKKHRPIAAGKITASQALSLSIALAVASLLCAYVLSPHFFILACSYVALQIAYSLKLRSMIILDALAVAIGFILRVYAGSWIIPVPFSSWLAMATIGLSLLIAFGKRRSEKTIAERARALGTRKTLHLYPKNLLDAVIAMSAAIAAMSYSQFAFQASPRNLSFLSAALPTTVSQPKWMMLTIPLVLYGLIRYLFVIYEKSEGESPEEVLLSDRPLLVTVALWVVSIVGIIYWLPG